MAKLDTIAAAYAVVFGRAADGNGLKYWEKTAKSMTDAQFVNYFIDTDAGKAEMKNNGIGSNKDYQSFVEVLYKNLFNKTYEDDKKGIDYWVKIGKDKDVSLGQLYDWIIFGALDSNNKQPNNGRAELLNKIEISKYMAKKFPEVPKDNEGNPIHDKFKEVMKNTTATNLDAQKALIDNMSFTDYFLTKADENITGTALNDTFYGKVYVGNGTKDDTISALDKIDGGRGDNDTLSIHVTSNNFADTYGPTEIAEELQQVMPKTTNVETLKLVVDGGIEGFNVNSQFKNFELVANEESRINTQSVIGNISIDLNGAGLKDIQNQFDNAKGDVKLSNLVLKGAGDFQTEAQSVYFNKVLAGAKTVTANEAKIISLDKVINLGNVTADQVKEINIVDTTVNNFTTTTKEDIAVSLKAKTADAKLALTANGTKGLKLNTELSNKGTVELTAAVLEKATVEGKGDLVLEATGATGLKAFDASKYEGSITAEIANVANSKYTFGAGDDTIKISQVASAQIIDGGAGSDFIITTSAVATGGNGADKLVLKNIEGLQLSDSLANDIDGSKWGSINFFELTKANNSGNFNNVANNSTISFIEQATLNGDVGVAIKDASAKNAASNSLNLHIEGNAIDLSGHNITANNIGTINIVSKDEENALPTEIDPSKIQLSANELTTLNISGNGETEITLTAAKLKTIDASKATSDVALDVSGLGKLSSYKGGSGVDKVTFAIKTTESLVIEGGEGKDKFIASGTVDNSSNVYGPNVLTTIKDFNKGDSLQIANAVAGKLTAYTFNKDLDFFNNVKASIDSLGGANKVGYFVYDGNTYIVGSGATAGAGADDIVIKLAGDKSAALGEAKIDASNTITL